MISLSFHFASSVARQFCQIKYDITGHAMGTQCEFNGYTRGIQGDITGHTITGRDMCVANSTNFKQNDAAARVINVHLLVF